MYTHGCVCQCGVLCFLVKYDVLARCAIYNICCDQGCVIYCGKGCVLWPYRCFIMINICLYSSTMSTMYKRSLWFNEKLSSLLSDQVIIFLLYLLFTSRTGTKCVFVLKLEMTLGKCCCQWMALFLG